MTGVEIRARWWRFSVRFMFCPAEIFRKFTNTTGSLRQHIFGKLYCRLLNNLRQKQISVMLFNHISCKQMYSKRHTYYHMLEMDMLHVLTQFKRVLSNVSC